MINVERIVIKTEKLPTSWAKLKEYASAGKLGAILQGGDTINITLKNGEDVALVVGKDENGTVYFICENCLHDPHEMNKVDSSTGGWSKTEMRRYLNEDVFALLPDDLQAAIKPTKIVQVVDRERVEVEDNLFCLSVTQVHGRGYWSGFEPEDFQIDIFSKVENRLKTRKDKGEAWWLRSADCSGEFRWVTAYGGGRSDLASHSHGVVFGFTI